MTTIYVLFGDYYRMNKTTRGYDIVDASIFGGVYTDEKMAKDAAKCWQQQFSGIESLRVNIRRMSETAGMFHSTGNVEF
jgi:hypothetical protein